ncbi:hypothetical protein S83_005253 [Arachis hypogaea]|uniref:Uncharacterized protein n=1 Tax=Arachis hypogaea TaxID=3818 RepID=A0A445EA86_ARAHY|nr:hypothetical protein Ahy_A02g006601 [Arachis hypogaea]
MKTAGSIILRTRFPTPTNHQFQSNLIRTFPPQRNRSNTLTPYNDAFLTLHEDSFTRVFLLSALRVTSTHCAALETCIHGHLLNWPRVCNIARVLGDDLGPDLASLVTSEKSRGGEEGHVSLQRRIYGQAEGDGDVLSPVLYREKLARMFNARDFVKFRNLAKISRPPKRKKKKKKKEEEELKVERRMGKNGFATVEVVEEDDNGGGILRNLVEEEFGREK